MPIIRSLIDISTPCTWQVATSISISFLFSSTLSIFGFFLFLINLPNGVFSSSFSSYFDLFYPLLLVSWDYLLKFLAFSLICAIIMFSTSFASSFLLSLSPSNCWICMWTTFNALTYPLVCSKCHHFNSTYVSFIII